jgi:hypothetical protein
MSKPRLEVGDRVAIVGDLAGWGVCLVDEVRIHNRSPYRIFDRKNREEIGWFKANELVLVDDSAAWDSEAI